MRKEIIVWAIDDLRDAMAIIAKYEAGDRDAEDALHRVKEKINDALDWLEEE